MARTQQIGAQGERNAENYLAGQGLKVVQRNYRCRGGEIDLLMQDGDTLVFVEVRVRNQMGFGGPLASVDRRKQQRLALAAQHYLQRHGWAGPCRFDVVGLNEHQAPQWIRNAFQPG